MLDAKKRFEAKTGLEKSQAKVRIIYHSRIFQFTAAFFILTVSIDVYFIMIEADLIGTCTSLVQNFIANIIEAQKNIYLTDNPNSFLGRSLDYLDMFFTFIFLLELLINAYGHWFKRFISDRWNILDTLVVMASLIALGPFQLPVTILRLLRAGRVVRLFGKLRELKRMLTALSSAVIPMLNSFLMMIVIAAICEHPRPLPWNRLFLL
jgi:hypothetical protein